MESFDSSSPNYMRATTSFDAKKEYSPRGGISERDDMISVTCSTCGSSSVVNKPYAAPKLNNNGIKHRRTIKNKTMKNFGNVKSFRRRAAKSRIIHQSSVTISDDEGSLVDSSESSPNYLKATSCSRGKNMVSRMQTLSRTSSSLRNVRILMKKTSFKPKRGLLKVSGNVAVTRGTHSSTLKDSKSPGPVELHSGGAKSGKVSAVKVCRYHHCSLHAHCQGTHDDDDPDSQRFLYKKRRSLKKQKSVVPKTESGPGGEKRSSDKKKNIRKSRIISIVEQLSQDENGSVGSHGYEHIDQELDFIEVAFGETSFGGMSFGPSGNYIDEDSATLSRTNEKPNKVTQANDSETNSPPTHQEGTKLQFIKQRHISMWHLIHQHMSPDLAAEPTNEPLEGNAEGESPVDGENSLLASKSTSSGGDLSDSETGTMSIGSENQEIELRKMFAIKLVRRAIENILLPEVQDQTSDDQSVTSETTPRIEIFERNQTQAITEENLVKSDAADKDESNVWSDPKQESLINDDNTSNIPEIERNKKEVVRKSEKKAPKHWSNLKKWILLQRFIGELEKVRKFNPKKPQLLPLSPDPGAEKVKLRHQTVDGRKNVEEWMLDYAIRQAVGQLAPTQKRKVALLVKAFETVAPTKEDPQVQYRIPRLKPDEPVFEGIQKDSNIGLNLDGDFVPRNGNSKLEVITADETEKEATRKPQDLQENVIIFNPVEGKTEESVPCAVQTDGKNHIKMWHMIYQHVVSGIAEKVGNRFLDGSEDDEVEDNTSKPTNETSGKNHVSNNMNSGFTKSDALKLVKEAVDEILLPEFQDDSSDTQSVTSELSISDQDISRNDAKNTDANAEAESQQVSEKSEITTKANNWSKMRRLILLKRSIKALEKARKLDPQPNQLFPHTTTDHEREKIEPRRQMTDEKKRAEQWMLDYAVQHIVTKLTPARKRRVSMLVEAFEAIVPLPEM